ncbi:MAG: ABC transporter permease [Tabrizicola sp.]|nr:ABC transporter permease [Tabrizicola sp.]
MVKVLPPIFLAVAAMLVNMTLSRLITLEREQIGLLKAIGYSSHAVAAHYVEFVLVIAVLGVVIGSAMGTWLGIGMAQLYARFFTFPYLVFAHDPQLYAVAAIVTLVAAVGGALYAVRGVVRLPPAIVMAPAAPVTYRQRLGVFRRLLVLRQTGVMIARHLLRWPFRSFSSTLGVAMAVALLVASQWSFGSLDHMIDVTFHRAERQDARIVFAAATPARATYAALKLPGVLDAEPFRSVPARIAHKNLSRKLSILGMPKVPRISRSLDPDLRPMTMPDTGLVLSEALAEVLDVGAATV